jgi:excisionase family DNA binding protein
MSVTIDRAAEVLGKTRRTVYNRIREGQLDTIRVGNSTRVTIASLELQPEFVDRRPMLDRLRSLIRHPHRTA